MNRDVKCNFNPQLESIMDEWKKFKKDPKVREVLDDVDTAFYNLIDSEFNMPIEALAYRTDITKGEVKGLRDRLDTFIKNIHKGEIHGKLASMMYTPSAFAKADPMAGELLDNFIHISHRYKGYDAMSRETYNTMMLYLKKEMGARGHLDKAAIGLAKKLTRKSAQAKADALEREIQDTILKIHNGDNTLVNKLTELKAKESELYTDSELSVYKDMMYLIEKEMPRLVVKKFKSQMADYEAKKTKKRPDIKTIELDQIDIKEMRLEDGTKLVDIPGSNLPAAMKSYNELMNGLHKRLNDGTKAFIKSILTSKTNSLSSESIEKLKETLEAKLLPDKVQGYFPHYARDLNVDFLAGLMPKLDDLIMANSNYVVGKNTPESALKNLETYLSGHTKTRSSEYDYSPNFMNVVANYMGEVNRFNYIAHIGDARASILSKIENMYKKGEDSAKYIENVTSFVNDMHASAVGKNAIKNKELNAFVRTLLGFEFISKIGMNPRSAARNASQMLLNFVEWSPMQIRDAISAAKEAGLDIEAEMRKNGLLFSESAPELEEALGSKSSTFKVFKINEETGKIEYQKESTLEKISKTTAKVAGSKPVAGMTRWVENNNRELTYKIAFGRMWKLLNNPQFTEQINRKQGGKATEKQVMAARKQYANRYAVRMVTSLHFDYSDFSKARAIRGPVGKVLGQFQHYSFKFLEKNLEVLRKGKNDIYEGEMSGANALKMYRLGLVYFAAPYLASMLIPVDFGNLIEHDMANKVEKFGTYFWGDEDDIRQAFYGKGPVLGTIGAPVISDLVTFGQLFDIINWDEDSLMSLIAGYQDFADISGDRKAYSVIKTLNTALGRTAFKTLPQLSKGNLGWAAQSELGLYPNKKSRKRQKKLKKLNPELFQALEQLEKAGISR